MSSGDEEGMCSNCNQLANDIGFCSACNYDFCEHCGFEGGCGVCEAEEHAWRVYGDAYVYILTKVGELRGMNDVLIQNAESMDAHRKAKLLEINTSLQELVTGMRRWGDEVQAGSEDIVCRAFGGGGVHSASDIMEDCGDSVVRESEWYTSTFEELSRRNIRLVH